MLQYNTLNYSSHPNRHTHDHRNNAFKRLEGSTGGMCTDRDNDDFDDSRCVAKVENEG